jgi:hypothetical protein
MALKRSRAVSLPETDPALPATKRQRRDPESISRHDSLIRPRAGADLLSPLSDELLLRVLSWLSLDQLLAVSPVSHRFHALASDSQLWKALYYQRFVLPRAMRIPGFRDSKTDATDGASGRVEERQHKLQYTGRRALWADGRRGGVITDRAKRKYVPSWTMDKTEEGDPETVDWKRQFKLRHNWSRGRCAVEELKLSHQELVPAGASKNMLVKVVEGVAITADRISGLRAWDLKTRQLLAQLNFIKVDSMTGKEEGTDPKRCDGHIFVPSCIAVDERGLDSKILDIALGFVDGSFGVWRFSIAAGALVQRYKHAPSSNGELVDIALCHPYILTATSAVLVSLYTFQPPSRSRRRQSATSSAHNLVPYVEEDDSETASDNGKDEDMDEPDTSSMPASHASSKLPAPYLITSLKSHTSRVPLALLIRQVGASTIASIAYTFGSRQGWSIGIQDVHLRSGSSEVLSTRLAFTNPIDNGGRQHSKHRRADDVPQRRDVPTHSPSWPSSLCYSHPYLLATLPDNTLILHLCTSTATSVHVSPGIRLWGHTSGISDAEITARGKAVSVSSRGEEMRVWELEGRPAALGSRSVQIRPETTPLNGSREEKDGQVDLNDVRTMSPGWDERRNWVGFDDEMVIVLKETSAGRESLMVYDFT